MSRIYLLVQNNVRTGPFTLEELLQQPLHDSGLVWVIGQSEDWLSPLEIPGLEPYYFKHADGTIAVKESVLEDIRSKHFINPLDNTIVEDHRPGVLDAELLRETKAANSLQASTLEEGSAPIPVTENRTYTHYTSTSARQEHQKASMEVKETDEDNLTIARKNWAVVGIAALLILFIAWNALFNDGPKEKPRLVNTAKKEPLVENTSFESVATNEKGSTSKEYQSLSGEASHASAPTVSTDSFLDSVQRVMDEQDQLNSDVDAAYRKSFLYRKRYPSRQTIASSSRSAKKNFAYSTAPVKKESTATAMPISQQVDLQSRLIMDKNQQLINAVELKVKNNSRELLKKVSVDVFYYKNGQKLLNKETVYFTNIYPKQLMTMSIASNQRATSARFELGTVSTGRN